MNTNISQFPRQEAPEICPEDQDLEFQLTDWYLPESDRAADHFKRLAGYPPSKDAIPEYTMFMYGSTADGHSVAVKVTDFQPYFFVKVPEEWRKKGDAALKGRAKMYENTLKHEQVRRTKFNRTTGKREEYMSSIIPYRLRDHLEYVKIIWRKEFWGFTNGEDFPFMKIRVKSHALFNILKRFFGEPAQIDAGFKAYESNIDPFLRFIHERNIKPCGWVRLPADQYTFNTDSGDEKNSGSDGDGDGDEEGETCEEPTPFTRASYNLSTKADNVYSLDINKIAPLLIASFDIECTSSHGDFPVAKKDYMKLATDLVAVAKDPLHTEPITAENITHWISDAYTKDTYIAPDVVINRVYPLEKVKVAVHVAPIVAKHAEAIVKLINVAAKIANSTTNDEEKEAEQKEKEKEKKKKTGYGQNSNDEDGPMNDLVKFLTKHLPKLAGDAIIQIGTTVTRFGSDEIIYKNIISLKSCDEIEGAEVEYYDKEDEVISAWKDLIKRLDPDIITGYNIFGFDMKYIWERAEELGICEQFAVGLGRMNGRRTILDKKELSSAALGDNIMYFFDMDGVISIDMLKVMQRDHKLDSYKLDNVASVFIGDKKDDISPRDIFEKFLGSSADRCVIAKYCIQDCALVNRLIHKLKVLENNVGMGNVCSVPLSYLFMRGQGIKIFSLVAKEARLKQHLIPVVKSSYSFGADNEDKIIDEEGYEGAIVLDPEEGMYLDDPIVVLDYNSLYPSSMISRNLSHDSYVADPESKYGKMQDKGITYQTVEYDVFEGKGDAKKVVGKKSCVFAQFPDGKKGIIPSILQNLLTQRKNTRKRMEYERLTLSDGRVAVGLVSEITSDDGTQKKQLEILNVDKADIGAGFGGHKAVIDASLVVERRDEYNKFEQAVLDALQLAYKVTANSLYGQTGSRTSPIYLKEIAACTTATGREMIYLAKNFVEERYDAKVIYGDSVMPYTPITYMRNGLIGVSAIEDLYWKCNKTWFEYPEFKPNIAGLSHKEQFAPDDMKVWTHKGWATVRRVIRHRTIKKIYRVCTATSMVDVTEDHSLLREDASEIKPDDVYVGQKLLHSQPCKYADTNSITLNVRMETAVFDGKTILDTIYTRVPIDILNSSQDIMKAFIKSTGIEYNFMMTPSHEVAQSYVVLFQNVGYNVHLTYSAELIYVHYDMNELPHNATAIQKCVVLHESYHDYVYDIETIYGVFHAGVGNMILKNTDSIFIRFSHKDEKNQHVKGKDALPMAIAAGQRVEKEIKAIMPAHQNLAYEKTLWPFIIFSKKRYVGNLYEDNINKFKQKSMGIVLKRRDNAPIVKKVYGGILDILLNKNDLAGSVDFLKAQLQEMVDGKVPLEDLIISKTLRGMYKDPSKIAHKVLARRMGERDPGNKPQVNDRIPFVFIKPPPGTEVKLQGDRIEHPDYIRQETLTPDYYHYITNQLMKPILQIFALCVEKLPGYSYPPNYWLQYDVELASHRLYTDERKRKDRIQALREKEAEALLFEPYLDQLCPPQEKDKNKAPRKTKATTKNHTLKSHGLDVDEEANVNRKEYIMRIECKQLTKPKRFKINISLSETDPTNTTAIWKSEVESAKKKYDALTRATEHAFKTIYTDTTIPPDVKTGKLRIITEKMFVSKWKNAFKNINTLTENMRLAIENQNCGSYEELQESQALINLVGFYENIPYTIQTATATATVNENENALDA